MVDETVLIMQDFFDGSADIKTCEPKKKSKGLAGTIKRFFRTLIGKHSAKVAPLIIIEESETSVSHDQEDIQEEDDDVSADLPADSDSDTEGLSEEDYQPATDIKTLVMVDVDPLDVPETPELQEEELEAVKAFVPLDVQEEPEIVEPFVPLDVQEEPEIVEPFVPLDVQEEPEIVEAFFPLDVQEEPEIVEPFVPLDVQEEPEIVEPFVPLDVQEEPEIVEPFVPLDVQEEPEIVEPFVPLDVQEEPEIVEPFVPLDVQEEPEIVEPFVPLDVQATPELMEEEPEVEISPLEPFVPKDVTDMENSEPETQSTEESLDKEGKPKPDNIQSGAASLRPVFLLTEDLLDSDSEPESSSDESTSDESNRQVLDSSELDNEDSHVSDEEEQEDQGSDPPGLAVLQSETESIKEMEEDHEEMKAAVRSLVGDVIQRMVDMSVQRSNTAEYYSDVCERLTEKLWAENKAKVLKMRPDQIRRRAKNIVQDLMKECSKVDNILFLLEAGTPIMESNVLMILETRLEPRWKTFSAMKKVILNMFGR
ncbi:magnetosome-associated protein MamJ-like [Poeciliopsis prolifica]|uniref:magnetosome-associated protein MamJ-like n=1 Tax=Poeciliopsis prolifica TaxID=188132 RepID=UPI002413D82D|nr:magnetosome-associated protein MamJ-like [Poeciliopsis prolifica]